MPSPRNMTMNVTHCSCLCIKREPQYHCRYLSNSPKSSHLFALHSSTLLFFDPSTPYKGQPLNRAIRLTMSCLIFSAIQQSLPLSPLGPPPTHSPPFSPGLSLGGSDAASRMWGPACHSCCPKPFKTIRIFERHSQKRRCTYMGVSCFRLAPSKMAMFALVLLEHLKNGYLGEKERTKRTHMCCMRDM